MDGLTADRVIDCYGLLCPMPLRKTVEALEEMVQGQVLEVIATDEWFGPDLEAWLRRRPQAELLSLSNGKEEIHAFLRKCSESRG